MPVPNGFEPLDIAARWGVDDAPDFVMHSGPIYVREDGGMPQLGFEVLPHMCNPGGVCHGGLLMTVLDNAFVFILHATLKQPVYLPSISCNFDFLAPAHLGEWVETSGSCTKPYKTHRLCFRCAFGAGWAGAAGQRYFPHHRKNSSRHVSKHRLTRAAHFSISSPRSGVGSIV